MPYRYFLKLAFIGTDYCGWQVQPNAVSVQSVLENALFHVVHHSRGITGCGRTDAGVHSRTFYAHVDLENPLKDTAQTCYSLNRFLPPSIVVKDLIPVKPGAHARFSAIVREYVYTIVLQKDPFLFSGAYLFLPHLDVDVMNEGAKLLLKHTDFECFSKVKTQVSNFNCKLQYATWLKEDHILKFTIRSDRFLRNMVRSIVGTLLDLGRGKITLDDLNAILVSRNRQKAGSSVPAKGLILNDVEYPDGIFLSEPEWFSEDGFQEIITHYTTDPKLHKGAGNETDE